ncbi:hypothetical protein psal_cds_950 [Pandoravirus salinus]|uniref:Uncharacterized protein n=1 Tax=Pandoravirus salinus TaxID=1349410 RepID=S4VZZ6_9VIRU|nr:hypothetical protein psal_cds_950 [Pandoravirus salinus]AGO85096.1 hypothetical protein psal_cds_950 [Pandoravirus salinus]
MEDTGAARGLERSTAPPTVVDRIDGARLLAESMQDAATRHRLASARGVAPQDVLASEYAALWSALDADRDASDAVGDNPRPTSLDVYRAYANVSANADEHVADLSALAADEPEMAATQLVEALGLSTRQTREAADPPETEFPSALSQDEWADSVIDRRGDGLDGCDPDRAYFVLVSQNHPTRTRVTLFVLAPADSTAFPVESYSFARDGAGIRASRKYLPHSDERLLGELAQAASVYGRSIPAFLRAFAERANGDFADAGLAPPWFTRSLVPLASTHDVPAPVRRGIDLVFGPDGTASWLTGALGGAWFNDCQLTLVLRMLSEREGVQQASHLFPVPRSLLDRAAAAYRGPLRADIVPIDVVARTAARTWLNVCMADPLPSGRVPRADALLDVARVFGVEPDDAQRQRPELLCGTLARPAVTEIARSHYGVAPAPGPYAGPPNPDAVRRWRQVCDLPAGVRPNSRVVRDLVAYAKRRGIALDADDVADPRRLCARLAVLMTNTNP